MIGVIIVTYHSEKHIGICLASVFSQQLPVKVLVVDNASEDETVSKVQLFPEITLIKNETNLGFSKAVNQGIRFFLEQGTEYILILNPDTHLERYALKNMLKTLEGDPKRMIVQPLLTMMKSPKLINTWGNEYKGFGIVSLGGYKKSTFPQGDRSIQYASGACMLVRSEAFRKSGLLDERYFLYFEDTEFSQRIRKAGDEIWLSAEAKVRHDYRKPLSLRKLGSYFKSWRQFKSLTK
ncbi:MAG: glycosyltransferase [Candidatus Altimarinota bacterium]